MFTKISVISIIKDHILTLKSGETNRFYPPDIILFFFFPAIFSSLMIYLGIRVNDSLANALITSFSIFSALLFNLLLLVYDISGKNSRKTKVVDKIESRRDLSRHNLLREIYVNVSFAILVSTTNVIILIGHFLKPINCQLWKINICSLRWLLAFTVYYLTIQFILTLLMVLKRIYKLLAKSFKDDNN